MHELLYLQSQYNTDVVQGPVLPRFEHKTPEWINRVRFFVRLRRLKGTKLKYSATNNVIIKNKWLHVIEGPFDVRLDLTGGENTLFFLKIKCLGAKCLWAYDAIVHEFSHPQRATAS